MNNHAFLLLGIFSTLVAFDFITAYFLFRLHLRLAKAEERMIVPSLMPADSCLLNSASIDNLERLVERNSAEIAQIRTANNENKNEIIAGVKAAHDAMFTRLTSDFMPRKTLDAYLTDLYRRTEALDSNGTKAPPFDPDADT